MDHKREHRTPPPLARVMRVGRQQQQYFIFISNHRALRVSLTCIRDHSERKQIEVRSLKRIQCDALETDLIGVNIDRECTDVNLVVRIRI